ncbi:MAG: NHL repeat-containing protein [Candidatus Auribacterota bacterium]|jgi:sugar lactone lactonase YvrE|nr:NHL repeat-containing protein [Candidatus Auribacterota bacterium]
MSNTAVIPEIKPDCKIKIAQDQCVSPSSIVRLEGSFVVCDSFMHRILWIDDTGKVIRSVGGRGSGADQMQYPTAMCIDDEGMLWVTDRWNHRIKRIDSSGKTTACFGMYGERPGQFSEPWGIGYCNGHIIVSDRNNHRIQRFSKDGIFEDSFGCSGPDKGYFESAEFKKGFSYTNWYGCSNRFETVETFFYKEDYIIGTMEYPCGLTVASSGDIFLVDTGNDRLRRFTADGELLATVSPADILDKTDFLLDAHVSVDGKIFVSFELRDILIMLSGEYRANALFRVPDGKLSHCTLSGTQLYVLDSWNKTIYTFTIRD